MSTKILSLHAQLMRLNCISLKAFSDLYILKYNAKCIEKYASYIADGIYSIDLLLLIDYEINVRLYQQLSIECYQQDVIVQRFKIRKTLLLKLMKLQLKFVKDQSELRNFT